MSKILPLLLCLVCVEARAAEPDLLARAVRCELTDAQLSTLIHDISAQRPDFKSPISYGAPSVDVYQLNSPVDAYGFSSSVVAVMPARILLVVSGTSVDKAASALHLEKTLSFLPASRTVRPSVSIMAFELSHKVLKGKLLVGCQYESPGAASWVEGGL